MASPVLTRMPVLGAAAALAALWATLAYAAEDANWVFAGPAVALTAAAWPLLRDRPLWAVLPVLASLALSWPAVDNGMDSVPPTVLTLLAVTYRIGERESVRDIVRALAFIVLTGQAMTIASGEWYPGDILFATTVYALPMILGRIVATGRVEQAELEARTAELDRERRRRAALEVARERERLAEQVNGIVTGALREMIDDAGSGLHALPADRSAAAQRLARIETTGRDALREMRALLGVLREEPAANDPGAASDASSRTADSGEAAAA